MSARRSAQSRRDQLTGRQRALAEQQAAQRRRERRLLAAVVTAIVVLLIAAGIGFQAWRTNRAPDAGAVAAGQTSTPVAVSTGQPISWGSPNAPVTVDLYADFHCPHCADFEQEYGQVLTEAQEAGRIRLRIFPMAFIDAGSMSAANGFACAAGAGFGQAYFTGLFANHTLDWSDSQLVRLAEEVSGSASPDFSACITHRSHEPWVSSINDAAAAAGVEGTPTMFVNGAQLDIGALTPELLETKIEEAATT